MKKRDSTCLSIFVIFLVFQLYLWPILRMNVTYSTKISQGMHCEIILYSLIYLFLYIYIYIYILYKKSFFIDKIRFETYNIYFTMIIYNLNILSQSQFAYDLNFHWPTSTTTRPFFMENEFVRIFFFFGMIWQSLLK
jgi:hypothetical protein